MSGWRQVRAPAALRAESPNLRAWQRDVADGHLSVFAGEEAAGFHLSISHRDSYTLKPGRYPTWDELHDARYRFGPLDKTLAMLLPPQDEYEHEGLDQASAKVAHDATVGAHRGRCWWHRVVLGHKQQLTATNQPSVGPAVWLHCSCDRWWSW